MRYKQDVDSHRVTLNCIMRDGLKKGVHDKQDVRVSPREYGDLIDVVSTPERPSLIMQFSVTLWEFTSSY